MSDAPQASAVTVVAPTAGGEDADSALATAERVAVSSAAAISIYKALSAMRVAAKAALGLV